MHVGLAVKVVAVAGAATYLLGPPAAGAFMGTVAWATGGGVGVALGSIPELMDGFNDGRTAADVTTPGGGAPGGGELLEPPTQPGPL